MKQLATIERALSDPKLLGAALGDLTSWRTWLATIKAAYGRPLTPDEQQAFSAVAGGRGAPSRKVRQFAAVVSRRGGKGRVAGAMCVYEACLVDRSSVCWRLASVA